MKFKILADSNESKEVEKSLMGVFNGKELVSLKTESCDLTGCDFSMVRLDISYDLEGTGQTQFEVTMQQITFNGVKLK